MGALGHVIQIVLKILAVVHPVWVMDSNVIQKSKIY